MPDHDSTKRVKRPAVKIDDSASRFVETEPEKYITVTNTDEDARRWREEHGVDEHGNPVKK